MSRKAEASYHPNGTVFFDYVGSSYNPRHHAKIAEREGFQLGNCMEDPKTLYVGNLDPAITEDFLATMFNQIGAVTKAKILMEDRFQNPYAFVEFRDNHQATITREHFKDDDLLGKRMKVNWAVEAGQPDRSKIDTTRHFHVFVGDLSSEVDSQKLQEAFAPFGTVSEAKVIKDTATNKPKGYGFVSYPKREDAERAIEQMNGQWLGRRTIRTNWASKKVGEDGPRQERRERQPFGKTFDEIFNQTGEENTSVYVGNINNLSEDEIREAFIGFGQIIEVRIFRTQGYAFVKFEEKVAAANAILQMHNQMVNGVPVRCSWGKNTTEKFQSQSQRQRPPNYWETMERKRGQGPQGPPPFGLGGPGGPPPGFQPPPWNFRI